MSEARVVVIGGGIAGLATAWRLALLGARPCVLEREPLFFSHASGRNAAIFREVDGDPTAAQLARRSRVLLGQLDSAVPLLSPTRAVYLGDPARLGRLDEVARNAGVACDWLDAAATRELVPLVSGGHREAGLVFPGDGVLDVHAVAGALVRAAVHHGAELRTRAPVRGLEVGSGQIEGVRLNSGEVLAATHVVVAAGAWTAELGADAGLPLAIEPRRRHLALLVAKDRAAPRPGPVVWRLGDEQVYFRPESGGYLASPCDEAPWAPCVPPTEPDALVQLGERLARLAPGLAEFSVKQHWACLRSFARDGGLVAGRDPRVRGLTWVAGLGGRGMSCGVGLGEVAAAAALGVPHPFSEALSVARLVAAA